MIVCQSADDRAEMAEGVSALIAAHYRLSQRDVLHVMAELPSADLMLLDSAAGWGSVGARVAEES